ncbi:MAG: NAD+ synthase, partial [Desulfatitalea sp.]|nr:NAD+ synthase [Desulfatitalea sp.]NNK02025.1 NAD+ synthase [Desulfatitalea sp.]
MKIAIVQLNPTIADFKSQYDRMVADAKQARDQGCDLVVFPELVLCGYPPRDMLEQDTFVDANEACLVKLIDQIHGIGVICGLVTRNTDQQGKALFNSAVLFEDGRLLYTVHKQLLPTYDVFDEQRHFEPGRANRPLPYKGLRLGLTICEDAWNDKDIFHRQLYATDPVPQLAADGMDLLINIAASPFHKGKRNFRDRMLANIARKHKVTVCFANQVGGNDHILFDGASTVFNTSGEVVARAADFNTDTIVYDTDTGAGDLRAACPSDTHAVLAALIMGTRDYVTKCGFKQAVIGLSGGIDSALTAYIATQALGPENVAAIFMPSRYTCRDNYEDTRALAENIGVAYTDI